MNAYMVDGSEVPELVELTARKTALMSALTVAPFALAIT
jgi:hypothetical protein